MTAEPVEFAIVGLGSWGLCVLERAVARARITARPVTVHVVEPGEPGGGVYNLEQPDYLVLNNPCNQLSLYTSPDPTEPRPYAMGLFEWATRTGYMWFGHECRIGDGGVAIRSTDYLPRRVMGEYLGWFYETLVADAPVNLTVIRHRQWAVDITAVAGQRERVDFEDGTSIEVDHVVLTSGHTFNNEEEGGASAIRPVRPYPAQYFATSPAPGEAVAMSGMGLVAFDLLTVFSIGRGGAFVAQGDRFRYEPSGLEPTVYLYSRSGLPYCAKSATGLDPTGDYSPVVCTPDVFVAMRGGSAAPRRRVDFRADVLPLLFAEMRARFYCHAALLEDGEVEADAVHSRLRQAWLGGDFDPTVKGLADRYGEFCPEEHVFPDEDAHFASAAEYERHVHDLIEADLDEALAPGGSPIKAALEVTRILRNDLRSVIEFGGLSLESYVDFQSRIRGRINRIEAGPPPMRTAQLLALMDAGIVRVPFGPSPALSPISGSRVSISSTRLDCAETADVEMVVRGHLDLPSLSRSASPLLARLYRLGRLTQLRYGDAAVGSVAISEDFHPFDVEGRLQRNISVLGVLTEGVRYFTHYLPSPRSRMRAVLDAQACVESVIG